MAKKIIEARVIQKVATEQEWLQNNLVLYKGEMALVSSGDNVVNMKVGDGAHTFSELEYMYRGGFQGSINPTTTTTTLTNGFYFAETSGTYTKANNIVVTEGYYTILEKNDSGWKVSSSVKMPEVSAVGKVEDGNTQAVSGGEVYDMKLRGEKLNYNSVSIDAVDFIKKSSNLFKPNSAIYDNQVISNTGTLTTPTATTDYARTENIYIEPNTDYYFDGFRYVAYYDKNGDFISRLQVDFTTGPTRYYGLYKSPANAHYIVGMFRAGQNEFLDGRKINYLQNLPYETDFTPYLATDVSNDVKKSITPFIKKANNLFDYKKSTIGKVISPTGGINDVSNYSITDFIEVIPNQTYTVTNEVGYSAFISMAFYDKNKVFLKRIDNNSTSGVRTIVIPGDVFYIRGNMNGGTPDKRQRMIVLGDTVLPYDDGIDEVIDVKLSKDLIYPDLSTALSVVDRFMIDTPFSTIYSTDETFPDITNFRYVTSAQVYQMYDDLMALYPDYITKELLGNDEWGNPISLYRFTPKKPEASISTKYPNVFLSCGLHGMEHTPPLACYLMFREMCNNWKSDVNLEILRWNVNFMIIPVSNPTGWNSYKRVNNNGVDINRNFPIGWKMQGEGTNTFSGYSPASELETQYIMSVIDTNNIDVFYDFHNFNGEAGNPNFYRNIWVSNGSIPLITHLGQMLIGKLTRKWKQEFEWMPQEDSWFAGWTNNSSANGYSKDYANDKGIVNTATIEVTGRVWLDPEGGLYTTAHKKIMIETITNWMMINVNELTK